MVNATYEISDLSSKF